jgi:uncharacterized protein YdeI (YjbR/CyaY-like superfamily)
MGTRDPRIDTYIAKAAPFAQPILAHFREIVHAAVPGVTESVKWSMPAFEYEGPLCNMAAFKAHCSIGFWKGSLLFPENPRANEAMGHLGRITSIKNLPAKKELIRILKEAARLNEEGVKIERVKKAPAPVETPPDLTAALKKNAKARKTFDAFPPSHRREYVEWITEAKTEPTRKRRLEQAVEWMSEGKSRNWKYEKKKV